MPAAMSNRIDHQPSVLWTLRRGDDEVRCEARLLPGGIEGRIVWNGRELYAFLFPTDGDLWAWARGRRDDFERKGWERRRVKPPCDDLPAVCRENVSCSFSKTIPFSASKLRIGETRPSRLKPILMVSFILLLHSHRFRPVSPTPPGRGR